MDKPGMTPEKLIANQAEIAFLNAALRYEQLKDDVRYAKQEYEEASIRFLLASRTVAINENAEHWAEVAVLASQAR